MNRFTTVLVVTALLLSSAVAFAQTARSVGMGYTGIAAADDASALDFNPAKLASLNLDGAVPGTWGWQLLGTKDLNCDVDGYTLFAAGAEPGRDWGFGVAYAHYSVEGYEVDWLQLGFGAALGHSDWQWGVSAWREDVSSYGHDTWYDVGLLYQAPPPYPYGGPFKFGVVIEDVTDEFVDGKPLVNAGIAAPLGTGPDGDVLLAVDWWGANDYSEFDVGLEYTTPWKWALRGGLMDGDMLTAGVGYDGGDWQLDVSWNESNWPEDDGLILATLSRVLR